MLRITCRLLALLGLASVAVGCSTTRTYSVTVTNEYTQPMTLWLTKNGPPMEQDWMPPEDLAMMQKLPSDMKVPFVPLEPGKSASVTRTGKFDGGVSAELRVYRGAKTLGELFAISRGSPNRTDVILPEGASEWVINRDGETVRVR